MKKLIIAISILSLMIVSCKKEDPAPQSNTVPTNTVTATDQDDDLKGTWVSDSTLGDGYSDPQPFPGDSLVITSRFYRKLLTYEYNWYWKTTSQDSLFIGAADGAYLDNMSTSMHYKYSISGTTLLLYYYNPTQSVKYWYHKK